MSDTPKSGTELLRESGPTIGEVIEELKRENAALREQVVEARRSTDYWKGELYAANTENVALRERIAELEAYAERWRHWIA